MYLFGLDHEKLADKHQSREFRRTEVAGSLEHPGIVPVYGLGSCADGRPFYAMRFIKGDSLKEEIAAFQAAEKKGRSDSEHTLALRQLLGRFIDVCQALAEEIEHWLAEEPVAAHRESLPARVARGARKRPALTAGVGALLVAGVIALGVSTLLIGNSQRTTSEAQRDAVKALEDLKEEQRQRALAQLNALRDAAPGAVPGVLRDLRENREQIQAALHEHYAGEKRRGKRMRLALALVEVEPDAVRDELGPWLLQADDPAEVRLVRDALTPHAGVLKETLWRQARDTNASSSARFLALSALAAFDPVLRGGSFDDHASLVRSSLRGLYRPSNRLNSVGFRVCRTYP